MVATASLTSSVGQFGRCGLIQAEDWRGRSSHGPARIVAGTYGWAPPGASTRVLGHEAVGRVIDAPADAGVKTGDLVVGIVRRPDPVPCAYCGKGEWDMCRNGEYTERGIKARHGYASERFRVEPEFTGAEGI